MCYHAEFGRSALKGVGINTEESPELWSNETLLSLGGRSGGPQLPQDTLSSLHVLPRTSNLVEVHQRVCA